MEGFLFKKGRGDSSFGRRNWKRRWFVLEDQLLTYYEDLDLSSGIPFSQKGMTDISGCEIVPVTEVDKKFAFVVKHPKRHSLYLQADDAKMQSAWIKALSSASMEPAKTIDYESCFERLGLSYDKSPTISEVNRAYRKAALKVHPDKGGDMVEFKKLQEAFEQVTAKIEEDEENKNFTTIVYEAVIEKGPQGVGVGMVVIENSKKGIIQIKRVMPTMMLRSLTEEADGAIRPGDVIVMVGSENVEKMPLSRVVQKIGDHRVPVGTTVKLTFTRRLNLDGTPEDVLFGDEKPAEPVYAPAPNSDDSQPSSPSPNTPNGASSYNFNTAPPESSGQSPPSSPSRGQSMYESSSFSSPSHLDPVQYVSVMAENEELKSDLETSLQQLNDAFRERDQLKADNKVVRKELAKYKALLSESLKRQKLLELQVTQGLVYGTVSSEQLAQTNSDMAAVSARLQADQPIQVSSELSSYMHTLGLDSGDVRHDRTKQSQRTAITASAAVDKSGVIVQKWASAGDSVVNKLSRFEESIARIESSRRGESAAIFQPPTQPAPAPVSKLIVEEPVHEQPQQYQHQKQQYQQQYQQPFPYQPAAAIITPSVPVHVPAPVSAAPASPYSMAGAAFSVSAAIKASNVLSPTATNTNPAASAYRGLASGGTTSPLGTRPQLSRAASEAPTSAHYYGSNGSVSSASRPTAGSPVPMNRTASAVLAGKAPLVFPKRATPPVPFNRVASSFQ